MIKSLLANKYVEEVSDERNMGNGIFCYLVKGWCGDDGAHCVREDTVKECKKELRDIQRCNCVSCK